MNTSIGSNTGKEEEQMQCVAPQSVSSAGRSTDGEIIKSVYRVGILALRGNDHALQTWDPTMTYLDVAVGRRFQLPHEQKLRFEVVPLPFDEVFDAIRTHKVDFFYVNPSMFSCMETEVQAIPLVTIINDRLGHALDQFAGVIFAKRNGNTTHTIDTLQDLKGKRIAATDIAELGSGQMQFRAMQQAGLHHLQDPRQILFTHDQRQVVHAVETGQADVGFVRTDLLERLQNPQQGPSINLTDFKIISQIEGLQTSRGDTFPFPTSTNLYPEWAFASLPSVATSVSRAVQTSLLNIADRASIAPALLSCYENICNDENDVINNNTSALSQSKCQESCFQNLDRSLFRLYDTTADLGLSASAAMREAKFAGFRPALSYMSLRDMQEETGFTKYDPEIRQARCVQSTALADAVVCPTGYRKRSDEVILESCALADIPCHGYQCLCSPCEKEGDPRDMLALVLPTTTIVAIACVFLFCFRRKLINDRCWIISEEEILYSNSSLQAIVVDQNDESESAPMLLADYKGTRVVVKSVSLPLTENNLEMSHSHDQLDEATAAAQMEQPTNCTLESECGDPSIQPEDLQTDTETGNQCKHPMESASVAGGMSLTRDKMTGFLQTLIHPGKFGTRAVDRAKLQKLFMAEMKRISKLRNPYITTVLGAVVSKSVPEPLLIMEYMELGSLAGLLKTTPGMRQRDVALPLLHDVVRGLRFLHASGIINGDLCARHVLIDSNFSAKLSSCQLSARNLIARADRRPTGHNLWMAPEILRHETYNTAESDVYAFGVLLYEVFSVTPPFADEEDYQQVLLQIADKEIQKRLPVPPDCPPEASELMKVCFREEPDLRPTAMEIDIRLNILDLDTIMHRGVMKAMQSSQFTDMTPSCESSDKECSERP